MKILIDADDFMNILNETQIEGDEYDKGLGKAKALLQKEILKELRTYCDNYCERDFCNGCERLENKAKFE